MPHLNRAVNDPLIDSNQYQPYSYFNPMVREMDLDKTLDLSSPRRQPLPWSAARPQSTSYPN